MEGDIENGTGRGESRYLGRNSGSDAGESSHILKSSSPVTRAEVSETVAGGESPRFGGVNMTVSREEYVHRTTPAGVHVAGTLAALRADEAGRILTSPKAGVAMQQARASTGSSASLSTPGSVAQQVDALLPKQTVVKIIGNNRTKSQLIGKQGVVKGAQTLGGWHEVLLEHGGFVRVQRNALEVVSMPAVSTVPQMVAPLGPVVAERSPERRLTGADAKPRTEVVPVGMKSVNSVGVGGIVKKRNKSGVLRAHANIERLHLASLRRYKRVFNLDIRKDCTRDELVFAVRKHFAKIKVDEKEVIGNFVNRLLSRRNGQTNPTFSPTHSRRTTTS